MLSIEEAWNLPISAEMSSRQQQQNSGLQQSSKTPTAQSYQKPFNRGASGPQGPPPPYPSPSIGNGNTNSLVAPKQSFKSEHFRLQSVPEVSSTATNKSFSPSNSDKLVQPTPNVIPSCTKDISAMSVPGSHGHVTPGDIDVSEEELKDFLSQKDLATTLAENLLKHFGSDAIDSIKEEPDQSGK